MFLGAERSTGAFRGLRLPVVKRGPLRRSAATEDLHHKMPTFGRARVSLPLPCPRSSRSQRHHLAVSTLPAFTHADIPELFTRRKSPKLSLRLRAPIELENLLPHDIQYRIYDKNTDQQWKSYLRHGGIMPVHSVELAHLVLLNITIQDTGMLEDSAVVGLLTHWGCKSTNPVILPSSTPMVIPTSR